MKDRLKIAVIGCGTRGSFLLRMILEHMSDIDVTAVCDLYEDRTENAKKLVIEKRGITPVTSCDYRDILALDEIDAVVTPSAWEAHVEICIAAMEAGKYVASEVGGAYSVDQCWQLVHAYEKTGIPCMMLENCCYGREELTVLNMIQKGLFGELVHCEGGYRHDLRDEVALGNENRHYRLRNYLSRNGDLYPTHELGPIAKYLNINRGNRMLTLTSMASKAVGVHDWIVRNRGENFENANAKFALGDVVTTMIKCANGETITLTHDTSLPRPYSRGNLVQGTRGIWCEDTHGLLFDGMDSNPSYAHKYRNLEEFMPKYEHPLWRDYHAIGGHGGIDYLVLSAFFDAVKRGCQVPIDVYDMASWMSITALSEASVAMGSAPVAIPDFTNGRWCNREPYVRSKYCLDEVCLDCFA